MPLSRLLLVAMVLMAALLPPGAAQAQAPACPCTVFSASDAPGGSAADDQPLEVGMKFRSSENGYISALRFYKQANNTGTHVGHLWTSTGTKLAEIEFTGETPSGWQEAALADAVPITAGTTYVVSYHSSQGHYARTAHGFDAAVGSGPLTAPSDASSGGNGVYRYGASGLPSSSWQATNYWVDAKFERTPPPDTRPPRVTDVTPASGATDVPVTTTVTATFDEAMDPASVTASTFTLTYGAGMGVSASVSYNAATKTATLTPSAKLPYGETFTASVRSGATGVTDVAGNPLAADKTWSFSGPRTCPCTVFAPTEGPLGNATSDSPIEVGMKLQSADDGFITALRFYKQPNNTGRHVGHLWTAAGQQLAEVEFTYESASGWQEEDLPIPIAITKNTIYVTSYHADDGRFAFSPGFFGSPAGQAPLTAPALTNGVYRYGAAAAFPSDTFNSTNYWVDAKFDRTKPPDTRPPRVGSADPAANGTGVAPNSKVSVTFDEPVDPLTVNTGSILLKDDLGSAVAGTVAYDAATWKATLTPATNLAYGKSYTATVKSGTAGVTDLAGNRLALDYNFTFSTPAQCPCTIFASDAPTSTQAVKDQPLEIGVKFRSSEDGFITSLRFYKHSNNTGTHVAHLWSATGTLLATTTYRNETASGWQQVELPNPVAVTKDTTYVASYHSSAGFFGFDPAALNKAVNRAPMQALANGVDGGNGVYRYGASAFPNQTYNSTNYWVDATFDRTIPPDTRGPTVIETNPANGAIDVPRTATVKAVFDEPLNAASVTPSAFTLRNPQGVAVPATTSYDPQTKTAELRPTGVLAYSTAYTATLKGGAGGVTDVAGNPIAADMTWTFTSVAQPLSEGPGGPILVVTDPANRFSEYYAEILRSEGLNAFASANGPVTSTMLTGHTTVVLATSTVSDAEVTLLTNWVQAGGNLIAMRPDKKLAGLLGLTDAAATLSEGYMKVNGASAAGAGIESLSMQYHGTADRYSLNGASSLATLYSNASTATSNSAVSLRDIGTGGGQAAAFAYDLARSVVLTRQGNPAWAGQKRDGLSIAIRTNDLFYGNKAGDPQPDWVDPNRFAVPQADEQQRLLANLITQMNLDKAPLPRFWYLPRGEKAALVLTGDDHAKGGTPAYLNRLKTYDKPGCSVADWQCVRATSYMYPDTPISDAQVAAYQAEGFELALHLGTGCQDYTAASLNAALTSQLGAFASSWPSARKPTTNRTHCTVWSDWATQPKLERANGIRFDTNYYYIGPPAWMQARGAGLMTGSGFPQRFGDVDGSMIDVYQSMTQVTDEAETFLRTTSQMHSLLDGALDNALGSKAYYGVFNAILHSDLGDHTQLNDMVSEALDRGVPVVSSAQMLDWLDGRNGSSFGGIAYDSGNLTFSVVTSDKARGIQAMLPAQSANGPLSRLTRGGQPVSWTRRTVKGVDYVVFKAPAGAYQASYAADTRPPDITQVSATPDGAGRATVTWSTDEPSSSLVSYGRTATLGSEASATAPVSEHSIDLTDLSPGTTYSFRVESTDPAGNTGQSAIATFTTPPGGLVDSRASDFAAGTPAGSYTGGTLDGPDGEVQLQPTVGAEFEGTGLPAGWTSSSWAVGGSVWSSLGSLSADGAVAYPTTFYEGERTLEFTATFRPVNNQGVGFSNDFSDYPLAAFTSGNPGDPFGVYASSGASPVTGRDTFLPGVTLNVPHRFRIVWRPTTVEFFVDGAPVATHAVTIAQPMRPILSDYGLFGASIRVHWLRQGSYGTIGTFTSRVLDSGPGSAVWGALTDTHNLPTGSGITFMTRSGATRIPDGSWSAWQPIGAGGAIASPAARLIQYRAQLTGDGVSTPTLERVSIAYGAGTNAAPQPGTVALTPAAPRTNQIVTATVSGFSDADGDPLTYHYRWLRNGIPIAGATTETLDLAAPGNGDRGDKIRVEVYATDGRGAASDDVVKTVTVANTDPTGGTVAIAPAPPATNDVVRAISSGFADIDGDPLSYAYQWYRNGTAIAGATKRTLDLSVPGNGDLGDLIEVEVRALDGNGGTSPVVRSGQSITATNSAPVAGTVNVAPSPARTDQTLTAAPTGFVEPDGQPITYTYRWLRNGTPISGATSSTLDLSQPGNGDRGDTIRAEVIAHDPLGARSEEVTADTPVVNSAPVRGTVTVKPATLATNDIATASVSGFSDADSDALTYQYQWYRNGTAIAGATSRTLDLSQPGNGDAGDLVEVEVSALDGHGGTSATARNGRTVTSGTSNPVASFGFEEAAGTVAVNETGPTDGTLSGPTRENSGRFGRALSFDGDDDVVTVPDDTALALTTGMTLEAWVKPDRRAGWRTVMLKESNAGMSYVLYGNSQTDNPSVRAGIMGDSGVDGSRELDPNEWTHLAATYDGHILRFYVNGVQDGSRWLPGELPSLSGPLTIGANNLWGERFAGLIDELRVYNRRLTTEEIAADIDRPVVPGTPKPPVDNSPDAVGKFAAPQSWPITPVHLALTNNGKVAAWDGFDAAVNSEHLWDPWSGQFDAIPTGRNLFCAGHIQLQDGRLLVAGGHIQAYEGTKDTNLFSPQTATWQRGADMAAARWYPTVTGLPDGRVFVVSGDAVSFVNQHNPTVEVPLRIASQTTPEIYNPSTDTWTGVPSAARTMPLYPFMFVLPDGRLFDAGPERMTRALDIATGQWTNVGNSPIDGMSAVQYRPGMILKAGTWSDPEFPGRATSNRAATIDMNGSSPGWQEAAPMKYRRSFNTLTVLPDGQVLSTGGQTSTDGIDETTGVLPAEMWNPDTNTWKTMASGRRPRLYHSSAILLPDARVLLAGGGAFGNAKNEKSGEIYSPPYLFKGPRPTVTAAPKQLHYGQSFTVDTPDASRIAKVSLVRMGSVTHNLDMDQRYMELGRRIAGDGLRIDGPSNANVAPPGWYMVFLVDDNGVPSTGQIVKIDPANDTLPPTAPTGLAATAQTDGASLTWNAASDNVGVDEYRVYRSTTAGFTPGAASRVARVPTGTSWTDKGLTAGTYYYRVKAVDKAGNVGDASNEAQAVVAGDTTAPTVSVTAPAGGASLAGAATVSANAADAVGVSSVQFKLDGQDLGNPDTAVPYSISWDTTTARDGNHSLTAVARDASGNAATSAAVAVAVHNTGVVAAYGFDEPSGTTASDGVNGHHGTVTGATRVPTGRYGGALSFDGIDDWVSIPHDPALNLSAGMTIEAWVKPSALTSWRGVVMKEEASALPYALYASSAADTPAASVFTTSAVNASGPPALGLGTWTHLAMTWDGSVLRLYVDGAEIATGAAPGALLTSTGQLRIGGNGLRGEFFAGLIDEVRVYDRALAASRIGADMNTPVSP
jgi:hypothetical protein